MNQIIDLLINNIHNDFEFELSEDKRDSIKFKNIDKVYNY